MVSSKGEPTDPELREKIKEEVKAEEKVQHANTFSILQVRKMLTNGGQGGGAGSWSAWKAGELARRYEAQGGDYKDTGDNKNKAQKGEPVRKSDSK